MLSIKTNPLALRGQQNQSRAQSGLETAMERLSSGSRVNSAKDDSAGQAIGNRMTSQINGFHQAVRNTNDGISLLQTAEGGLDQINDNLQRIRELTVQGLTDTLNDTDKVSVINEINSNIDEIDRIKESSNFNSIPLLQEDVDDISLQIGANKGDTLTLKMALLLDTEVLRSNALRLSDTVLVSEPENTVEVDLTTATVDYNYTNISFNASDSPSIVEKNGEYYVLNEGDNFELHKIESFEAKYYEGTDEAKIDITVGDKLYSQLNTYTNNREFQEGVVNPDGSNQIEFTDMSSTVIDGDIRTLMFDNNDAPVIKVDNGGTVEYFKASPAFTYEPSQLRYLARQTTETYTVTSESNLQPFDNNIVVELPDTYQTMVNGSLYTDKIVVKNEEGDLFIKSDNTQELTFHPVDIELLLLDTEGDVGVFRGINYLGGEEVFNYTALEKVTASSISEEQAELEEMNDSILAIVDDAITTIDTKRSYIGASVNRLESIIDNLNVMDQNLTEARSRILDADYAVETGKLAKSQILQQASTSMLAQANQNPDIVLSLLEQI